MNYVNISFGTSIVLHHFKNFGMNWTLFEEKYIILDDSGYIHIENDNNGYMMLDGTISYGLLRKRLSLLTALRPSVKPL